MFTVLRSSAGAGKTHTLVKHYLEHCLRGDVTAYRQVLALTFTNKAAGEMKERVVDYLEKLAAKDFDSPALGDVLEHLLKATRVDEDKVAHRANEVLRHMLHHWSDVAISTIDAFTRRVVQPFARDLQLDHDLRMTTDEQWYRDSAVDALIAKAGIDPQVTELLSEACRQLIDDERKWDPGDPLRELSQELTKESAIDPLRELQEMDPSKLRPLIERLRQENARYKRAMQQVGTAAVDLIEGAGLVTEDLYYGSTGFFGWFKKLRDFEANWIVPGVQALKSFDGGKWHGTKAGAGAQAALAAISGDLLRLYQQGETLREGQRDYFLRKAVLRELAPAFALRELDRCLADLKRTDGVAFFSDLTRRVAEVVRDEPVPFIYERMGERYAHFLIDEFQDTSLMQWYTLLPLIDNALAQGGSALIVGDAKQAIYRWRNGEVRLFRDLPAIYGRGDDPVLIEREASLRRSFKNGDPLVDNRRSARTIVDFNNTLFSELSRVLPEDLRPVYNAHEQRPHRSDDGLVRVEVLPKDKSGTEATEHLLEFATRCVHQALEDGFSPDDIGVLVRSGELGRTVASHLVAQGWNVISPDGLRLSGDVQVELLVELLRFLNNSDAPAAARIMQYRAQLLNDGDPVDPFAGMDALPDPLASVRAWLADNGDPKLRTTLEALVDQLARMTGAHACTDAHLLTLLDEVNAFSTEHGQGIDGFLQHWERRGAERSMVMPAGGAIQVMTVHKAKGLEFPVVIVPNARMASSGNHLQRAWIAPGGSVPELPHALVRVGIPLREAGLSEIKEEEEMRVLDHLDLLYVAFTRPQQRLYALVPEPKPDPVTAALLAYMESQGTEGKLHIGVRTPPWKRRAPAVVEQFARPVGGNAPRTLALRFEAPAEWDPTDPDPYRRMGNAVHEVLSRVEHSGMLDEVVTAAIAEGVVDEVDAEPLRSQLNAMLASAKLQPYYGSHLTVRTEASIITADGRTLRPDRLVFDGDTIRVLDIKTGAPREEHHQQVATYMRVLGELGPKNVEGALLYTNTGELVPVGP